MNSKPQSGPAPRKAAIRPAWGRRLGWSALIVLASLALLMIGTLTWDRGASVRAEAHYPARGSFVTVNHAQMHVICQGQGEPTLALQAGIAGGALDWLPVMAELAPSHRVCAFDRLGQDWSDPAPTPRTFATAVDEWHIALQALGIDEPIVVGHSLGGAVVQLYAARYPVSGVILVDGLTAHAAEEVVQRLGVYQMLDPLGRAGMLRPMGGLFADDAYPAELRQEMAALRARNDALLAMTAEGALAASNLPVALTAAEALLEAPLLVIAAGSNGLPEAEAFLSGQERLVEQHPTARLVQVAGADHYVLASHPQLVAETIEVWLNEGESVREAGLEASAQLFLVPAE